MPSPFPTKRQFSDSRGWYAVMRTEDQDLLTRLALPGRRWVDGLGVVVGPFSAPEARDRWLASFLSRHGETRRTPEALAA